MKVNKWMMCMALGTGLHLVSCTSMDEGLHVTNESQQGQLELTLTSGTEFGDETRAFVNESDYKNTANYTVKVFDKDGVEKLNCKGSELSSKMPLTLSIGSYTVEASYGEKLSASREFFYVEGTSAGTIKADQKEPVEVECTPTCGRIKVEFDANMKKYFRDYKVTFTGTKALHDSQIVWGKDDTAPWYLLLDKAGEEVNFTITTITNNDYLNAENKEQITDKSGKFTLSRNKGYKMVIKPTYIPGQSGTPSFDITIDSGTNDKDIPVEVPITWI